MKFAITNIILWIISLYFQKINSIKYFSKNFFSKYITSEESKLRKYKSEISKFENNIIFY